MNVELVRIGLGEDSTLGRLLIDGEPQCFTLEDERRQVKVRGETCIPEGRYRITLRTVGGFHGRYGVRFGDMHRGMLWVRDVPGFEYILIHVGNDDGDTAGCILVGARPVATLAGEFLVHQSVIAYRHIYPPIAAALEQGEDVWLTVRTAGAVDAEVA